MVLVYNLINHLILDQVNNGYNAFEIVIIIIGRI